ncbi:MAG: TerB family tellurite resistance protein [Chromatiaceae bacterium]|nr:TerB family tellurite resistance protein [Chromatiaceae bacterium]
MTFDEQLEDFFNEDITSVIADPDKFKRQLGIGADAYKLLSTADRIHEGGSALLGGAGVAGTVYAGWFTSLGALGQIGLAAGLVATPIGAMVAAGTVGAGGMFLTRRLLAACRRETVEEIPHFINSPIDVLGASIADIIIPILLRLAHADGVIHDDEIHVIERYLTNEWGFNEQFVQSAIDLHQTQIAEWDWSVVRSLLKTARETRDIDIKQFKEKLLTIAQEVAEAEGGIVAEESAMLAVLQTNLTEVRMRDKLLDTLRQAERSIDSCTKAVRSAASRARSALLPRSKK